MKDFPKDPKIAELPLHRGFRHESDCKIPICTERDRILRGLWRWRRWRCPECPPTATTTTTTT